MTLSLERHEPIPGMISYEIHVSDSDEKVNKEELIRRTRKRIEEKIEEANKKK